MVPWYRSAAAYYHCYTHQKVIDDKSKGHKSKYRSRVSMKKNAKQTEEKLKVISVGDTQECNRGIHYLRLRGKGY